MIAPPGNSPHETIPVAQTETAKLDRPTCRTRADFVGPFLFMARFESFQKVRGPNTGPKTLRLSFLGHPRIGPLIYTSSQKESCSSLAILAARSPSIPAQTTAYVGGRLCSTRWLAWSHTTACRDHRCMTPRDGTSTCIKRSAGPKMRTVCRFVVLLASLIRACLGPARGSRRSIVVCSCSYWDLRARLTTLELNLTHARKAPIETKGQGSVTRTCLGRRKLGGGWFRRALYRDARIGRGSHGKSDSPEGTFQDRQPVAASSQQFTGRHEKSGPLTFVNPEKWTVPRLIKQPYLNPRFKLC